MDNIAKRDSWKTLPLPPQQVQLHIDRTFSEQDYKRLAQGLIPKVMEDKWFIYIESDVLSFHRSWTGVCIYEVHFDSQHAINEVWVNREANQFKETDSEYDEKLLTFLINNLLLEQNTPFPVPSDVSSDLPRGVYQHGISGTGYPEKRHQRKKPRKLSQYESLKKRVMHRLNAT